MIQNVGFHPPLIWTIWKFIYQKGHITRHLVLSSCRVPNADVHPTTATWSCLVTLDQPSMGRNTFHPPRSEAGGFSMGQVPTWNKESLTHWLKQAGTYVISNQAIGWMMLNGKNIPANAKKKTPLKTLAMRKYQLNINNIQYIHSEFTCMYSLDAFKCMLFCSS